MIGEGGRGIDVIDRSTLWDRRWNCFPVIIARMHLSDKRATWSLDVTGHARDQRLRRPGDLDCRQETNLKHVR
jgi:hypothetical protein